MLYLFLGPDDFTKKEKIRELAKSEVSELAAFGAGDEAPAAQQLIEQNLFSKSKVFLLEGMLGKFDLEKWAAEFIKSSNYVYFLEEKLDKRLNATKELLKNKSINVQEFPMPHGRDFETWIERRISQLGGAAEKKAVSLLAQRLGRDETVETKFGGKVVERKEIYTLWQAHNEVAKLLSAGEGAFSESLVRELVAQQGEPDVFAIVNAIGEGRRAEALAEMRAFLFSESGAGEKEKIIHLNALLSEQLRSIALFQHFASQGEPEESVLKQTGWKSGRLYMLRKISPRFQPKKVLEALEKFSLLDEELKTGSTPPGVLLDLIIVQLLG